MEKPAEIELFRRSLFARSPHTQDVYLYQYRKARKFHDKDMETWDIQEVFDLLETFPNINTRYGMLSFFCVIRPDFRDDLRPYRDVLVQLRKESAIERNQAQLTHLPRKKDLDAHEDMLFESQDWKNYVIHFLLTHTYCRNQDCFAWIKDEGQQLGYENYLVRSSTHVTFIRNKYKTVKAYGVKRNVLTDTKFRFAVSQLMPDTQIAKNGLQVAKATYKGVGEGAYFKICVLDVCESGKNVLSQIKHMELSRGTDLDTMITNYNLQI
jgi:hypothetical protein